MYIVITLPDFWPGEAQAITLMFQSGLQRLHLRKPGSTAAQCRQLLQQIPACYHPRIVLHDHFMLLDEFTLGGVHLNGRNPMPLRQPGVGQTVSCSCHSISELQQRRQQGYRLPDGSTGQFHYLSLSPICDSISKSGYRAAFTHEQLRQAAADGIIDHRVVALGGISQGNIEEILALGFGGAIVLGDAWQPQDHMPAVLSIAGSDPTAGAGIQQDLKTFTHLGTYGCTVITAVTAQNTMGVQRVMPVPAQVVRSQLRSVFSDVRIRAVKVGMIPNAQVARVIIDELRHQCQRSVLPIVLDPVMLSTSGTRLMSEDCVQLLARELFPLCTLITPNIPEYDHLSAQGLLPADVPILRKGGHADGPEMTDTLHIPSEAQQHTFTTPRVHTTNLHGTGCTLSSAIAAHMAHGHSLVPAIDAAKSHITRAIQGGRDLHIGHGNGPLWYQ